MDQFLGETFVCHLFSWGLQVLLHRQAGRQTGESPNSRMADMRLSHISTTVTISAAVTSFSVQREIFVIAHWLCDYSV